MDQVSYACRCVGIVLARSIDEIKAVLTTMCCWFSVLYITVCLVDYFSEHPDYTR